jgi:hypothetical protein
LRSNHSGMTHQPTSLFEEASDLSGYWHDCRQFHFWHDQDPFAVKHLIETMTGTLFQRDPEDTEYLTYVGTRVTGNRKCVLRLRFLAVIGLRNLYALQMENTAACQWVTQVSFLYDLERAHQHWSSQVTLANQQPNLLGGSQAKLHQRTFESLVLEQLEATAPVENQAPHVAVQNEVLAALRAGRKFHLASKEGGTILSFHNEAFIRTDYGEEPRHEVFPTGDAMLACLRHFYDWSSRQGTYPHRTPEFDVWRYIQRQLRD